MMNVNETYLKELVKNSEKQAKYRKNMKAKGYIQTTVFIPAGYRTDLRKFVNRIVGEYERSKK